MKRRNFISLLGGAAATWSLGARAQQPATKSIGMLMGLPEDDREGQTRVKAFRQGLAALGWFEGRNIRIDYR